MRVTLIVGDSQRVKQNNIIYVNQLSKTNAEVKSNTDFAAPIWSLLVGLPKRSFKRTNYHCSAESVFISLLKCKSVKEFKIIVNIITYLLTFGNRFLWKIKHL